MKQLRQQIKLLNNQIIIPFGIVKSENLLKSQRYELHFFENRIELIQSDSKINTWKFYSSHGAANSGFKLVIKPELIPDNLRNLFDKGTRCLYEINEEKIIIHF